MYSFSSHVLLVLEIKVFEALSILVLAVQLHSLGSGQLVEFFLLILHLLISLPQLQVWSSGRDFVYGLADVVNFSLVHTENDKYMNTLLGLQ